MEFNEEIKGKIEALFSPYDQPSSPGFAVGIIHDGRFIYKKGFGHANLEHPSPIGSDTVFDVGSMAKQFVGMAIALLEGEGRLAIDDEICGYLPEFSHYARGVTIANLLYHTSGIRNYTVLAYYMIGYHESDAIRREDVYQLLTNQNSLSFEPGEKWEYSDSNYFLLAQIVERITGRTMAEYASANIFFPLGMDDTLFRDCHSQIIKKRAMSYVRYPIAFRSPYTYRQSAETAVAYHTLASPYEHVGAEGLFTTVDDLFMWNQNLSDDILGEGVRALTDRVLTQGRTRDGKSTSYGFGINIGILKGKQFVGHDGAIHGYSSSMLYFPEEVTSIICLSNQNEIGAWKFREDIMHLIFPSETSKPMLSLSFPHSVSGEEAHTLSGAYQNPETASIWKVDFIDGRGTVSVNRAWEFDLIPVKPLLFRVTGPNRKMQLKFLLDEMGQVLQIQGVEEERPFTYVPFLKLHKSAAAFEMYAGEYHCEELETTFIVDVVGNKLRFRNKNSHFCSMDLLYEPTIKDSFIAYDPHPVSSQITFIRKEGEIRAFVYRDFDGDRREALEFLKQRFKSR